MRRFLRTVLIIPFLLGMLTLVVLMSPVIFAGCLGFCVVSAWRIGWSIPSSLADTWTRKP